MESKEIRSSYEIAQWRFLISVGKSESLGRYCNVRMNLKVRRFRALL